MRKPKTLRARIETRLARKARDCVFLTREFADLSGETQVLTSLIKACARLCAITYSGRSRSRKLFSLTIMPLARFALIQAVDPA